VREGPCGARVGRVAHANAEGLSLAVVFPSCLSCASSRELGGGGGGGGTLTMQLSDLAIAEAGARGAVLRTCTLQSFPFQLNLTVLS